MVFSRSSVKTKHHGNDTSRAGWPDGGLWASLAAGTDRTRHARTQG